MASGSLGSIYVDLLLRSGTFDASLSKSKQSVRSATSIWTQDLRTAGTSFKNFNSQVSTAMEAINTSVKTLGVGIAAAFSGRELIQYGDRFKTIQNRIAIAAGAGEDFAKVQERLFDIASKNSSPVNDVVDAYARLNLSLTDVQKAQTDTIQLTDLLAKTLKISGANAAGAATFYQQFGQAASSDFKAIGQELQTFADQNPFLYKILQDEARTYGKTLRQMGADGELSFDFINQAIQKNAGVITEQAGKVQSTVSQAFTNLDTALLKYIGTSEAAAAGTSSVAIAINTLADNFQTVAEIGTAVALIYVARMVPAIVATSTAFVTMNAQSIAVQLSLARMEGIATGTAVSLLGLGAASRGVSAALGLVGGPIGIAAIYAITNLTMQTDVAKASQEAYNSKLTQLQPLLDAIATGTANVAEANALTAKSNIDVWKIEAQQLGELVEKYAQRNTLAISAQRIASKLSFGLVEDPLEVALRYNKITRAIEDGELKVNEAIKKGADFRKQLEDSEKTRKQAAAQAAAAEKAAKKGGRGTSASEPVVPKEIDDYINSLDKLDDKYKENVETSKMWALDTQEMAREASRNIQNIFADFLYDPFKDGLKGMLSNFSDMLRRMAAEAAAKDILGSLFGQGGLGSNSGGLLDGVIGSIGSSIGSSFGGFFASGGELGAGQWGVVGENGPELAMGGTSGKTIVPMVAGGGGGGITVNVINNSGAQVTTQSRKGPNGPELDVMIDQLVANKLTTTGTAANNALQQYSQRSLTRR